MCRHGDKHRALCMAYDLIGKKENTYVKQWDRAVGPNGGGGVTDYKSSPRRERNSRNQQSRQVHGEGHLANRVNIMALRMLSNRDREREKTLFLPGHPQQLESSEVS